MSDAEKLRNVDAMFQFIEHSYHDENKKLMVRNLKDHILANPEYVDAFWANINDLLILGAAHSEAYYKVWDSFIAKACQQIAEERT